MPKLSVNSLSIEELDELSAEDIENLSRSKNLRQLHLNVTFRMTQPVLSSEKKSKNESPFKSFKMGCSTVVWHINQLPDEKHIEHINACMPAVQLRLMSWLDADDIKTLSQKTPETQEISIASNFPWSITLFEKWEELNYVRCYEEIKNPNIFELLARFIDRGIKVRLKKGTQLGHDLYMSVVTYNEKGFAWFVKVYEHLLQINFSKHCDLVLVDKDVKFLNQYPLTCLRNIAHSPFKLFENDVSILRCCERSLNKDMRRASLLKSCSINRFETLFNKDNLYFAPTLGKKLWLLAGKSCLENQDDPTHLVNMFIFIKLHLYDYEVLEYYNLHYNLMDYYFLKSAHHQSLNPIF